MITETKLSTLILVGVCLTNCDSLKILIWFLRFLCFLKSYCDCSLLINDALIKAPVLACTQSNGKLDFFYHEKKNFGKKQYKTKHAILSID